MKYNKKSIRNMILSSLFLAMALVLPFVTGQIPQIGSMLLPMHIPVMLCGFICGPWWGLAVGVIAPILRSLWLGMPPMFPTAAAMAVELGTYALSAGLMFSLLPDKRRSIYVSLIGAMICGRIAWGCARMVMSLGNSSEFPLSAFIAGAFTTALPGIILQIILVPAVIMLLRRYGFLTKEN